MILIGKGTGSANGLGRSDLNSSGELRPIEGEGMTMTFRTAFTNTIEESLGNNFDNNYDYYRFGKENELKKDGVLGKFSLRGMIRKMISPRPSVGSILKNNTQLIEKFEYLYNLLADEISKELLVKILAYRVLGYKKVKLPTSNEQFWKTILSLDEMADKNNFVNIDLMNWKFYHFDLEQIGYPIKIYSLPLGVYINFVLKQYEYNSGELIIKVDKNDIVIDAGGFSGDNALHFAYETGSNGRVYTFEFIPSNLVLMQKNLDLNPDLKDRIKIVRSALWSESGMSMYCHDNGPASGINSDKNEYYDKEVKVMSIDDFVITNKVSKVDFIKMDIEGSELSALKGAEKTLMRFRPKLAISLYHRLDDFRDIPQFIKSLDLGYEFYLGHYTIHAEETVLYAGVPRAWHQ
jgi:FkbM family methyltransferase